MPLTKDEISDLRSLQQRVLACAMDCERADNALKVAKSHLDSLLFRLEHEYQQPTPVQDQGEK